MRFAIFVSLFLFSAHYLSSNENLLVDYVQENLGISLKVPYSWNQKAFVRGKTTFFPTPTPGSFLMMDVMEPQNEDYSAVDLEFAMHDLMNLSDEEQKISDFEFHKTTLSELPAYDVTYVIEREKRFRTRVFFTAANEKIYILRYQSINENFKEYEKLFVEKIVPSFKIQVISQPEMRYQFYELPEFGFSFYCPSSWRIVRTNYARTPMPVYADLNTGTQIHLSSSSGEEIKRTIQRSIHGEGTFLGSQDPVFIAADPESYLVITVVGLSHRYEPADAIESYFKGFRSKAKELADYRHLREFPIKIDGNLAMEYAYSYQAKEDDQEKTYYVNNYITYANERLYHIRYSSPEEKFSKHVKEVERLVKYFRFIAVS